MANNGKTVYRVPNGYARDLEVMYNRLRHANLNPRWGFVVEGYTDITLTEFDAACLLLMAAHNPATYGNQSTIKSLIFEEDSNVQ